MRIVCISGKARAGKDTVAKMMKDTFTDSYGIPEDRILVVHYADLLKYICEKFFRWNGKKDEKGRSLLQYVGTDVIRKKAPNYWVTFVADMLTFFKRQWSYVIIPDTRFPNEIDFLKSEGHDVVHIRIIRETNLPEDERLTEKQMHHVSENALNDVVPDIIVLNNGSMDSLRETVKKLASELIENNIPEK